MGFVSLNALLGRSTTSIRDGKRLLADAVFELPNPQGGEQQRFCASKTAGGGEMRLRFFGLFRLRGSTGLPRFRFRDALGGCFADGKVTVHD